MRHCNPHLLIAFLALLSLSLYAQDRNPVPLIGDVAPAFSAQSTQGMIQFPDDYFGKWKIIFSHPADFTAVCTSEIFELAQMQDEFREMNTQLIVLSTDGLNSHFQWVESIMEIEMGGRKARDIEFPIIADDLLVVSRKYGMIHPGATDKRTIRAVFIIDPEEKIRMIQYYPMEVGRNFDEIIRSLRALQLVDKRDYLTPANWQEGDDVLLPSPGSEKEAAQMERKAGDRVYSLSWYLWFKKM